MTDIYAYLKLMNQLQASDLFLTTGAAPSVKVDGLVHALTEPRFSVGEVRDIANGLMSEAQKRRFETTMECNFSWSQQGLGRYRINVFHQRGEVAMVMRKINSKIADFDALGLPAKVAELAMVKRGLVLVVGAEGSGKSTTMAAMIKYRSEHAAGHILTIEDPIEFLFSHALSLVDQREVGIDTLTFGDALRNALREAPDVIMLGEIRDLETAQYAIAYAQTGHLCISTLHANNANQAIERLLGFFPEEAHNRVLHDLSLSLKAVVSQRLITTRHQTRLPAVEIMLQTPFLSDLMQRGKLSQIKDEMAKSNEVGMVTFDQSLFDLYQAGKITYEQAMSQADSPTNLGLKLRLSVHHSAEEAPALSIVQSGTTAHF